MAKHISSSAPRLAPAAAPSKPRASGIWPADCRRSTSNGRSGRPPTLVPKGLERVKGGVELPHARQIETTIASNEPARSTRAGAVLSRSRPASVSAGERPRSRRPVESRDLPVAVRGGRAPAGGTHSPSQPSRARGDRRVQDLAVERRDGGGARGAGRGVPAEQGHRRRQDRSRPSAGARSRARPRRPSFSAESARVDVLKSRDLAQHTQDDAFREIQLNGKQLVFLFMVATVFSVVIFLCGVFVGRGVRAERAPLVADVDRIEPRHDARRRRVPGAGAASGRLGSDGRGAAARRRRAELFQSPRQVVGRRRGFEAGRFAPAPPAAPSRRRAAPARPPRRSRRRRSAEECRRHRAGAKRRRRARSSRRLRPRPARIRRLSPARRIRRRHRRRRRRRARRPGLRVAGHGSSREGRGGNDCPPLVVERLLGLRLDAGQGRAVGVSRARRQVQDPPRGRSDGDPAEKRRAVHALDYSLALASGALLALSFPKFGHPAFGWIALAPLLVALSTRRRLSLTRAFYLGLTTGARLFRRDALLDHQRDGVVRRAADRGRRTRECAARRLPGALPGFVRRGRPTPAARLWRAGPDRGAARVGGDRAGTDASVRRLPVGAARLQPGDDHSDRPAGQRVRRLRRLGAGRERQRRGGRLCGDSRRPRTACRPSAPSPSCWSRRRCGEVGAPRERSGRARDRAVTVGLIQGNASEAQRRDATAVAAACFRIRCA